MIGLRQFKPIHWLGAIVARVCPYCQADLSPDGGIKLCHVLDISNYNIRAMEKVWHPGSDRMLQGWQKHRCCFTPNKLVDLD